MTMRIARSLVVALFTIAFVTAASAQATQSHYAEVNGIRMHYLQAGSGEPFYCTASPRRVTCGSR